MTAIKRKSSNPLNKANAFDWINGILLTVFVILMVYPIYQCLVISLNDGSDIQFNGVVYLWPRKFSLESYATVLGDSSFGIAAFNTIARTVLGSLIAVLVTSGYAFAISHKNLVMRKFLTIIGVITMYIGGGLIPTFLVVKDLGLYDTFWVYLLLPAFTMFNCTVFVTYFKGIGTEIEESAMIDGANDLTIFFRIIVPIAKPVFACILLFVAVQHWNSYQDCMIYTKNDNLTVLSYRFARMLLVQQQVETAMLDYESMTTEQMMALTGPVSSTTLQMATMMVTVIPIICVYPFLQRYFVKGIMVGSLKG